MSSKLKISKKYLSVLTSRFFTNEELEEYPNFTKFIQLWLEQSESMYIDSTGKRRYGFWRVLSQLDSFVDIERVPDLSLKMMIDVFAQEFSDNISFIPYFVRMPEHVDLLLGEPLGSIQGSKYIATKTGRMRFPHLDSDGIQQIDSVTHELKWKYQNIIENGLYIKEFNSWKLYKSDFVFDPNQMDEIYQYDEHHNLLLNYDNIRNFLRWSREFHKSKGSVNSFYALFRMFRGNLQIYRNADDIICASAPVDINVTDTRQGILFIRFKSDISSEERESIVAINNLHEESNYPAAPIDVPNYKYTLPIGINPTLLGQTLYEQGFIENYRAVWSKDNSPVWRYTVASGRNPHTNRFDHLHGIDPNPMYIDESQINHDWWYTYYAYTLVTDLKEDVYKDIVCQIVHPAGMHITWDQKPKTFFQPIVSESNALNVMTTYPLNNSTEISTGE